MASTQLHEDGIYFGLPEAEYHADLALGSTGLKLLAGEPAEYWHSYLSPEGRREHDKKHQVVGKAVHKYVLEGPDAFHSVYEREPDEEGLLTTIDQLKDYAATLGITKFVRADGSKGAPRKEDYIAALRHDPHVRIRDAILARAEVAGRIILSRSDYDAVTSAADRICANPELTHAFIGGYPEVSVFWTELLNGIFVRRKCRFDFLCPTPIVDLKSITPYSGIPFVASCRKAIANFSYDVQAEAYLEGRTRARDFARDGRVFVSSKTQEPEPLFLESLASVNHWYFMFIFWASKGVPLTWGTILSPGNEALATARIIINRALDNYTRCVKRFGSDKPWLEYEAVVELQREDLPAWYGRNAA